MIEPVRLKHLISISFLLVSVPLGAQANAPTASEVVARIRQHAAVQIPERTVDTFKSGDPETRVKGIAVTMMSTLDVLQQAVSRGDNFIITHEPTFFTSRDTLAVLENERDPVFMARQRYIRDHGLVIWRFHDTPHAMKPDMIQAGIIRALGWERYMRGGNPQVFDLPATKLRDLARNTAMKVGATAPRFTGDPNARVSKVALTQGFWGFPANRHALQGQNVDVLVIGEDHEWETIEYANDAIVTGELKGLIVLGHIPSEQAGMEQAARWLRTFVTEVPVEFVPSKDLLRAVR